MDLNTVAVLTRLRLFSCTCAAFTTAHALFNANSWPTFFQNKSHRVTHCHKRMQDLFRFFPSFCFMFIFLLTYIFM